MASLIYSDESSRWSFERALVLSLMLHALLVVLYPMFTKMPLPAIPDKIAVELLSVKMSPPVEPQKSPKTPVEPILQSPKPVQKTAKPVLATPNNETNYQVAEQVEPVKTEPAPVLPTSATPVVQSAHQVAASSIATESSSKEAPQASVASRSIATESEELTASDSDAWGDYGEQLRSLVNKSKQYPSIAVRRHLEGDTTVVAQFVRGELVQVVLNDSSNHVPLDEEAMRMVKKAIAQLVMNERLKKKTFRITIPVSFKLE